MKFRGTEMAQSDAGHGLHLSYWDEDSQTDVVVECRQGPAHAHVGGPWGTASVLLQRLPDETREAACRRALAAIERVVPPQETEDPCRCLICEWEVLGVG